MLKGRVTIPTENDFLDETIDVLKKLKADAVRNCDGTDMPDEIIALGQKVYQTYFVCRGDNQWVNNNLDEVQQLFLGSKYVLATQKTVSIDFLDGYLLEQIKPDYFHDVKKYWQVFDRTTNTIITDFEINQTTNEVTIKNANLFHEYSVNFLAYVIWDPTQMYNHITNNWTKEHEIPFDIRLPKSNIYMLEALTNWLENNPKTDVVRFTTFFYHFTLVFNDKRKEKFVDWFGYGTSVSVKALEDFKKEYGYELTAEDFITSGSYNSSFNVPTKKYLDYMDFIQKFVSTNVKKLVDIVHSHNKEAMMFLGDNWIGTEPYGKYFKDMNMDAVVGSVGSGATLRMISDIPHVKYTEGRFLPYFFPDTFYEGNDPCIEARENWLISRRAIMRKPVDRIGYGGYLSLAYKFPKFMAYIESICDEFRLIYKNINNQKPFTNVKVAVLNSFGKVRSWQTHMVAHALWYKEAYTYQGIIEALSGLAVDVKFISFDDVINTNVLDDIDCIINAGIHDTSFSGGVNWDNEILVSKIREFVYNGKGFIGVGEPAAYNKGGRFFQIADILGVDKELGFTLSTDKYNWNKTENHFIFKDNIEPMNYGESTQSIYAINPTTQILDLGNKEIFAATNNYGEGRGVYLAGLPYNTQNTRVLLRSIYYACNKENEMFKYFSSNPNCEVSYYPSTNTYAIINNSNFIQETKIHINKDVYRTVTLQSGQIKWFNLED